MGCGELARNQASTGRDRARWTYETSSDSELTVCQRNARRISAISLSPSALIRCPYTDCPFSSTYVIKKLLKCFCTARRTWSMAIHSPIDPVLTSPRCSKLISLQSALHHSKILLALTGSPSASSSFGLSSYCLLRRLVSMPDNSPSPNVSSWSSLCKNPGMWSLRPARRPGRPRSRLSIARSAASRSARLISCTEERSSMSACEYVSSAALLS